MHEEHDRPLALTLWRTFSRGRHTRYTWREFVDTFVAQPEVVRDKRKVAGFSLGSFSGNRRALSRVEGVHALVLDFDRGDTTLDQTARLLPGVQGVAHTTFSHTPAHPKLRAAFLLSRPVLADEYARIWAWAEPSITKAGHVLDESARDASRFWYLPSHRPGAPYEWREFAGAPLDVEKVLAEAPPLSRLFPVSGRRHTPVEKRRSESGGDGDAADTFFGAAFAFAGLAFEPMDNGALPIVCPWRDAHTSGVDGDSSTVILPADGCWGLFYCSHAHCVQRRTSDLLDVLPPQALNAARAAHGRGLLRVKVVQGWKERLDALPGIPALERFVLRCRPGAGPIFAMTVKPGSVFHQHLDELSLQALLGRRIDVVLEGGAIKSAKLVQEIA
jgi:hypothetical protein